MPGLATITDMVKTKIKPIKRDLTYYENKSVYDNIISNILNDKED